MQNKLRSVLAGVFKLEPSKITADLGPHNLAVWDSAAHMRLILALEKEFGIQFTDEEVVELISLSAIETAVARHLVR